MCRNKMKREKKKRILSAECRKKRESIFFLFLFLFWSSNVADESGYVDAIAIFCLLHIPVPDSLLCPPSVFPVPPFSRPQSQNSILDFQHAGVRPNAIYSFPGETVPVFSVSHSQGIPDPGQSTPALLLYNKASRRVAWRAFKRF